MAIKIEKPEPIAAEPNSGLADVGALAGSLASEQPEVSEHTVAIEMQKTEQRKAQFADLKDTNGAGFDPAVHVTDSNGDPVTTSSGKLRKRPGRKAGGDAPRQASHIGTPGTTGTSTQNSGQDVSFKRRATGVHAARMLTSVSVMIGGEEWKPIKNAQYGVDEQEGLNEAFADYFEAKEMEDIPPGMVLAMVMLSYAGPRFAMPKTQSRVGKLKDWFASKYFNYKVKKSGGKVQQLKEKAEPPKQAETK